jgi:hypothetical protein
MSRAINFALTEDELTRRCNDAAVGISVIEALPRGGTRLVCSTNDGAELMRRRHSKDMLEGPQKRHPFFVPTLQR